jgi:pyruvate formate lyase activating enzyme
MLSLVGGGITFSGGEPLSQGNFVIDCLKLLKGRTHRAIQTSGFCPQELFAEALQNCDYVLYDLKLMNDALHQKYTGVSNQLILANYRTLAHSGKEFITRIPLIPGVNDTEDNLTQTAQFMTELNVKKIELLPYNKAAGAKYKAAGLTYQVDFNETAEPNPHCEIFSKFNIEVNVL